MDIFTTVIAFLVALGVLIIVHELGHYAVARACGVRVLRFSVGFGRPLLRWRRSPGDTEWVVSAVPYGGYVKMLDENDPDCVPVAPADLPHAFNRQPVAKRAAIVSAGPAANLFFAVLLYWLLGMGGTLEPPAVLGPPPAGSVAAQAGLGDGDRVVAVNGRETRSWSELRWELMQAALSAGQVGLDVRSIEGSTRHASLDLSSAAKVEVDEAWFEHLGVVRGAGEARVRALVADGVAAQAGLRDGDLIVSIDDAPVRTATEVARTVREHPGVEEHWRIERDGTRIALALVPARVTLPDGTAVGRVGIDFLEMHTVRYGPGESFGRAVRRTWDTSVFSLRMVGRMIDGRSSWRNLSGPVTIADVAGQTARLGVAAYVSFIALVSISLGVLNLLPVPVLDGGHLLYYAVELIKGSPPSLRVVEVAQRVGVGLLVLLTALALYNDLTRLLS